MKLFNRKKPYTLIVHFSARYFEEVGSGTAAANTQSRPHPEFRIIGDSVGEYRVVRHRMLISGAVEMSDENGYTLTIPAGMFTHTEDWKEEKL